MDDQGIDPIDEALSAVEQQFAGNDPPNGADTLDASDQDDAQLSDDLEASDTDLEASDDETATAAVPDWSDPTSPYHGAYQQAVQAQQRADEAEVSRERAKQFLDALRVAKTNEQAKKLHDDLNEIDPQLAQQYLGQRAGLVQQVQAVQQETVGYQHGMAALHLAMTDLLDDDGVAQVVARARELAQKPGLEHMQWDVQSRRQTATQESARVAELEKQNKVLRLQVAARQRDPNADVVDSSPVRRGRVTRPEDAKNMDEFFDVFKPFG